MGSSVKSIVAAFRSKEFVKALSLQTIGGKAGANHAGLFAYVDAATGEIVKFGSFQDIDPRISGNPQNAGIGFRIKRKLQESDPPSQIVELIDHRKALTPQARANLEEAIETFNADVLFEWLEFQYRIQSTDALIAEHKRAAAGFGDAPPRSLLVNISALEKLKRRLQSEYRKGSQLSRAPYGIIGDIT